MQRKVYLAFDDYIEDTQSTYSSTELNNELGAYDAFVLQVVTDDVVNATAITVQLEVSSDGRRWTSKNAVPEVNAAALTSGVTNNTTGVDPGTLGPAPSLVRLRIQLTNPFGGATKAHVKIYCRAGEAVGPFQPNHLGGCILWLRSDLGITLSGGDVALWADQSPANNDAAKDVGSSAPTYNTTGGVNGFPRLTGGGGRYLLGNITGGVGGFTLFAVATYPSLSNNAAFAGTDGALTVNSGFAQFTETPTGIVGRSSSGGGFASATTGDTSSLTKPGIYTSAASAGTMVDLWINGVSKASTAVGTLVTCTRYMLFGLGLPLQYNLNGDAYEYALYNRALQPYERALVHNYLGGRYGIAMP